MENVYEDYDLEGNGDYKLFAKDSEETNLGSRDEDAARLIEEIYQTYIVGGNNYTR